MTTSPQRRSRYSIVVDVAELVRSQFIMEVQAKRSEANRSEAYAPNSNWDWEKSASFILDKGLNIPQWIHYVVKSMATNQPNHLHSEKIYERYGQTASRRFAQSQTSIVSAFQSDKGQAHSELALLIESNDEGLFDSPLRKEDLVASVLCNDMLPLSALFRYCWAVEQGSVTLAESYYTPAVCQYLINPDIYDKVWGSWLPEEFKEEARTLFKVRT